MSDADSANQLKRALQAIKDLRARLEAVERTRKEPIALIGMACRFPGGANSPEAFWQLLKNRTDAIAPVPADRWDVDALFDAEAATPGKVATRWGGFLARVDEFDAPFFNIAPREAMGMDPQQRLLLEVAWEALENAGQTAPQLAGSQTGVFVGVHSHSTDYYMMQATDPDDIDIYTGTGTSHSVTSGRLSYLFDLRGPNVALDTACSSSLVAVHLACQSLRAGESNLALAGGVNLMLTPHFTVVASKMRMMAADGRCKTFDARADGFVRGEGCGVVILKRLSDAVADGDPILALIRGSAINQDGHTNGLTAPNGLSQQAVIRQALENAGVSPEQITYVETHGTGTPLGDPIEVEALGAVLGQPRADGLPCALGSVKTNLGHLEGAAGVAGLIKAVLALQHHTIPANLHFEQLNPHITLAGTRLTPATEERAWPAPAEGRFAGVSSFGWSGTNAHAILEEAPALNSTSAPEHEGYVLPLSAHSAESLKALAEAHREALPDTAALPDVCYTASVRRTHHAHRLAVAGRSVDEVKNGLTAFLNGEQRPGLATGYSADARPPGLVFVFPGQGGQWVGMGRQLLEREPVFRAAIEQCAQAMRPYVNWDLIDQLTAGEAQSRLDEIDVVQPALFAMQVGLAAVWRARGVEPEAVVGHSLGEVAAAHVAGALSLDDAARIICARSRLMKRASGKGAMTVVELSMSEAQAALVGYEDRLSIAVNNGPRSVVLSGDPAALAQVTTALQARNVFCRAVKVDVAAHSPHMEPFRAELVSALAPIRPQPAALPIFSTVTGEAISGPALTAEYWGRNLREPVLFAAATQRLMDTGHSLFIEISPHPVLLTAIEQTPAAPVKTVASLRRNEDEMATLWEALGQVYVAGHTVDWKRLYPTGRVTQLPPYAWQRKRYWVKTPSASADPLRKRLYHVDWKPQARAETAAPSAPGQWLIASESDASDSLGAVLAARLTERGERCVQIAPNENWAHVEALLAEGYHRLVYLRSLAAPNAEDLSSAALSPAQTHGCGPLLHWIQLLAKQNHPPRLWLVTQNAQAVDNAAPHGLAQAPVWGLGRVLAFEHPELWGGLIDLDSRPMHEQAADVLAEVLSAGRAEEVAFRAGQRLVARLSRTPDVSVAHLAVHAEASYLITGGLGGLGLKVAHWLAAKGARHLALMSRSAGAPEAREAVRALEQAGAQVLLVPGDVSREADVARALDEIARRLPPLRGVLHSAGVVEDALLSRQTEAAFGRAFASKVAGAWNLHQQTQGLPLDWFVLFSSAASLLGTPGQSNYAAANAFLDSLAHYRRAQGYPALALNWGQWAEVGLAVRADRADWLARLGLRAFSPAQGLAALERLLPSALAQAAVLDIRWETFAAQLPLGARAAFFAEVFPAEEAASQTASATAPELALTLEATAPAAREDLLRAHLLAQVASVMRFGADYALEPAHGFFQLGMDSLMAVELKNRLQKQLGRTLRSTLAFDYPNVNLLARYLLSELFPSAPPASAAPRVAEDAAALAEVQALSKDELKKMLDDEMRSLAGDETL